MFISGYSSSDLATFQSVYDSAMTECMEKNLSVSSRELLQRLLDAAAGGERDAERLKEAMFGASMAATGSQAVRTSTALHGRRAYGTVG